MPQIIVQAHTPEGTPGAVTLAERPALLARSDTDDQLAAEWLYAWAYNALRPRRDSLAARITNGAAPDHALKRRVTRDAASDQSVKTITSKTHNRAARRRRDVDPRSRHGATTGGDRGPKKHDLGRRAR